MLKSLPAYQSVLELFSLAKLEAELHRLQQLAQTITNTITPLPAAEQALDNFTKAFCGDLASPSCPQAITQLWEWYDVLHRATEVSGLHLALKRRRLMLCNAAAWYWLMEHCSTRCRQILAQLVADGHIYDTSNDWFERLVTKIYHDITARRRGQLRRSEFLPHVSGEDVLGIVPRPRILEEDPTERICNSTIDILRSWLHFPNNKEMLSAYFVIYVVGAFKNIDVLLLNGVWCAYLYVPAQILGIHKRASLLRIDMLRDFGLAVRALPLARHDSPESSVLHSISQTVEKCSPGLRRWTETWIQTLMTAEFVHAASETWPRSLRSVLLTTTYSPRVSFSLVNAFLRPPIPWTSPCYSRLRLAA